MNRIGGKQAVYERFHGRSLDELVAEWCGFNPASIVKQGQVDSLRYTLLAPVQSEESTKKLRHKLSKLTLARTNRLQEFALVKSNERTLIHPQWRTKHSGSITETFQ